MRILNQLLPLTEKDAQSREFGTELGRGGGVDSDPRTSASGSTSFPSDETDPPAEDATGPRTAEESHVDDADQSGARHPEPLASSGRHQIRRPAPST